MSDRPQQIEVPTLYTPPSSITELLKEIEIRKPLTLHQRIAAITGECKRIPKNGWNDFHKFSYCKQADVVAMTSQLTSKYGVLILQNWQPYHPQMQPMIDKFLKRMDADALESPELEYLGNEIKMLI